MKKLLWTYLQTLLSLFLCYAASHNPVNAQAIPSVGLINNTTQAFNGYTLFAPSNYTATYLIDNCGRIINTWQSQYAGVGGVYLLENGHLLRTSHTPANQTFSGAAGRIEESNWEGSLQWGYTFAGATFNQHHDAIKLPSGNILLLSWDTRTREETASAGRKTSLIPTNGLWSEKIVELKPIGKDSALVVWEWRIWDHLVQDNDSTKANFGIVAEHPNRLDMNFLNKTSVVSDWIHFNGLAYNADLDQIIVSSRELSEIYIIDHSTTTAEAASSRDGRQGKGGDFLWRWGNPQAYKRGTGTERKLFGQHNPQWIAKGLPGAGNILLFNNGDERPDGAYSTIEELQTPITPSGAYTTPPNNTATFAPSASVWTYKAPPPTSFFSQIISGVQRLPNGNTLICEGTKGKFFEITQTGAIVWEYRNPVGTNGPVAQGTTLTNANMFRCFRYAPNYAAFTGRTLTPGAQVELNPTQSSCTITTSVKNEVGNMRDEILSISPNPASNLATVSFSLAESQHVSVKVFNVLGQEIASILDEILPAGEHRKSLNISNWSLGNQMLFLQLNTQHSTLNTIPLRVLR